LKVFLQQLSSSEAAVEASTEEAAPKVKKKLQS
jgi:hypothetical protein